MILQWDILPGQMIIKTGRTSSLGDRKQHCRKAPNFKLISKKLRKLGFKPSWPEVRGKFTYIEAKKILSSPDTDFKLEF